MNSTHGGQRSLSAFETKKNLYIICDDKFCKRSEEKKIYKNKLLRKRLVFSLTPTSTRLK